MTAATIATQELRAVLEAALQTPIRTLRRRPYRYATSHALEEFELETAGGAVLELLFKDFARSPATGSQRSAKPAHVYDPLRELLVYQQVLDAADTGAPRLFAAVADTHRRWLFIEKIHGTELWQVGELSVWMEVARWLARFHGQHRLLHLAADVPLVRYGSEQLAIWRERLLAAMGASVRPLMEAFDVATAMITEAPATFLHGEFYPSNVLIADGGRVRPVDWEMAAIGPGALDLAALLSGWGHDEQAALIVAYRQGDGSGLDDDTFERLLAACRLQQAAQWLAWSPHWQPPPEHVQDWLAVVQDQAERLR
ncbi:MAG: phosphotransferase [Actinobacteria bacterium]|nr:phosphotransferase [Actinomycetota bacterium]